MCSVKAEGHQLYVQLQYALHEVNALRAKLSSAADASVSDAPAFPETIYEVVASEPTCGEEEPVEDSTRPAGRLPFVKARPLAKPSSQCRQLNDTTRKQRVAKASPIMRRTPSVPRSVNGHGDSTGGACAPGGDGDDPPDPSRILVDDGRDGEPDEEDTAWRMIMALE